MADDTAALVVALSAQLTKFEKDLQKAVGIADTKTKQIETRFAKTNASINASLSALASTATGRIGVVGEILGGLGKAGTVAAIGLGVAVGAIAAIASVAERFAEQADKLKTASETIGITITQFKALGIVGLTVGKDFDSTAQFFERFVGNLEALKQGQGPLFDILVKLDKALLSQLTNAKNSAEAIDILAAAFKRLDESQRIVLARAAGGRGGTALLAGVAEKGGLTGAAAGLENIDAQTRRIADLNNKLTEARQKSFDLFGAMFTEKSISDAVKIHEELQAIFGFLSKIADLPGNLIDKFFKGRAGVGAEAVDVAGMIEGLGGLGVPLPTPRPAAPAAAPGGLTPEQQLKILRDQLAIVGELITVTEQRRQKELELQIAIKDKVTTDEQNKRVLEGIILAQKIAVDTARERFGIATEEQIVEGRLASLRQDQIRLGLTEIEVGKARNIILRESKDAADRLTVRQSYLPGLAQLAVDISRVDKEIDKFAVQSLNTLTDGFADVITGTKKLSDAFREMVSSILKELARLLLRQAVIAPLLQLLGFSGSGGGGGFIGPPIPGQAAGTNNFAGGWTWVGEKGPELVNLPKGSQVVPNDVARGGVGGVSVGVTSTIVVQGDASERTLMLIEAAMARQKRELPNDIVKTVREMQSRRVA